MPTADRGLADVAADAATGAASPAELHDAFLTATVYRERPGHPGFRALGPPGAGVVPVYSSAAQLALARGPVDWFAMPGRDLLAELPAGYDLLLDMAGPAPLRLATAALRRLPGLRCGDAEITAVVDHQFAEPDRYVGSLGQLTGEVRFGAEHHVAFTGGGRDWAARAEAGERPSPGTVSTSLVAGAPLRHGAARHAPRNL